MNFGMNQANDGTVQSASIAIPGCGNNHVQKGAAIAIEIIEGKPTLLVYGDVNSKEPTHEIDMSGALEKNRKREEVFHEPVEVEA